MSKALELLRHLNSLRAELDVLEQQIKDVVGDDLAMLIREKLKIPIKPASMLAALIRNERLDKARAITEIYTTKEPPKSPNILEIYINTNRQALKPHNIEIKTIYGFGWFLEPYDKAALCNLLGL